MTTWQQAIADGIQYFGSDLAAYQTPWRHRYFPSILKCVGKTEPRILEVGSWAGQSLCSWNAVEGFTPRFTVVDTWKADAADKGEHYDRMREAADTGHIYTLFRHNVRVAKFLDRVDIICASSMEVLPKLPPNSFDVIYIDGSHRYPVVKSDIANAIRLIDNNGVICGDDLERQYNALGDIAQHRYYVESEIDFVEGYHPGVTEAVYEAFGNVACLEGLWAVRKNAEGDIVTMGLQ